MINIEKPKISDLEQIRNIFSQWTEIEEVEKYLSRISNEINGQTEFNMQFWVACENKIAVGVVGLSDPLPKVLPFAKTEKPGEIKILYVDTKKQGKGIGRFLVDFIEEEAIAQGYSELLIRSAEKYRETAYRFYEKMDYVKVGVVDGEDSSKKMQVFGKVL